MSLFVNDFSQLIIMQSILTYLLLRLTTMHLQRNNHRIFAGGKCIIIDRTTHFSKVNFVRSCMAMVNYWLVRTIPTVNCQNKTKQNKTRYIYIYYYYY